MLWIDVKYANLISNQLLRYKVKQTHPYLSNFRCPVCGDSKKDHRKARAFLFTKPNGLFFKCHNCGASFSFGKLLKIVNSSLYDEYKLERYREGLDLGNAAKPHAKVDFSFSTPVFKEKNVLDRILQNLNELPESNIAVQYAIERKLPRDRWNDLYFIDDVEKISSLNPKYTEQIKTLEPRLLIPFYDAENELVGVTLRSLTGESLRYIAIRIDTESPMVYNLNRIDKRQKIFVLEGPIDSIFLPNAVAVNNADLKSIREVLPNEDLVLVFDNQPRNRELIKQMSSAIEEGFKIVIWPEWIEEKDINQMVTNGMTTDQLLGLINTSTFSGLRLKMNFEKWRKLK